MTTRRIWSNAELATLKANYMGHGAAWEGWDKLLPGRSCSAIWSKASTLGMRYDKDAGKVAYMQKVPTTCGECVHFRPIGDGRGRCVERHAVGLFRGAPEVRARFTTDLCPHRIGKMVRI